MNNRSRIFLGYAHEDEQRVRQLYRDLKSEGFLPWMDKEDILPGQDWQNEILKAIKSAGVFLACLSKNSVAKKGYVQREFRTALSVYAELPPDTTYLIPAKLDDCDVPDHRLPQLELGLRDLQWVDLFDGDGFERLVTAIRLSVTPNESQENDVKTSTSHLRRHNLEAFRDINEPWCPRMVVIPAGEFIMGPSQKLRRSDARRLQRKITICRPFALGQFPVTFDEFDHFCEEVNRPKPVDEGWGRRGRMCLSAKYYH